MHLTGSLDFLTASKQTHNIDPAMKAPIKRFGIIADDLTGAMDTGAAFAKMGLDTIIIFGSRPIPDATVVVISTNSRVNDPKTACRKVKREARKLSGRYVYKKIDSTLRGNIGQELKAVMDALDTEKTVVSPAFPTNKRTVVNGRLLVGNVPVDRTSFARDPVFPVTESHIPTLLHKQAGFQVGSISLDDVKKGPSYISRQIANSEHRVIVADATEQVHLRYIAEALAMGGSSWLPCGSAGLAMELPLAFGYRPSEAKPAKSVTSKKPVLVVVGSRHEATARQVKMAETCLHLPLILVSPSEFTLEKGKQHKINQMAKEVGNFLNCEKNIIITSAMSQYVPALEELTANVLAKIAVRVIQQWDVGGFILTGGDVAKETCEALGAIGVKILKELEPSVVVGEVIGGVKEGLRIVTKAGGFGSDQAIVDSIYYLERNERWNKKRSLCSA